MMNWVLLCLLGYILFFAYVSDWLKSNKADEASLRVGQSYSRILLDNHHRQQNNHNNHHQHNDDKSSSRSDHTKIYALYFPQYHEDVLNNRLWGQGFTDWANLLNTSGFNRYNYSLLHPHEFLGYYNLTDYGTRKKQRVLAERFGIDGFIYHHYWFYQPNDDIQVLAKPLLAMLEDGEPNISFALNWAKESFFGAWSGRGNVGEILYEQWLPSTNDQAIRRHYAYLQQFFRHPNYIKLDGVPIFFVYPRLVPKPCRDILVKLSSLAIQDGFPPPGIHVVGAVNSLVNHELYSEKTKFHWRDGSMKSQMFYPFADLPHRQATLPKYCYDKNATRPPDELIPHYVSTVVQFDNTPRRTLVDAEIWNRSFAPFFDPFKSFAYDLAQTMFYERCCTNKELRGKSGKFIAINAWNEWGEGMVLEPSQEFGFKFLQIVKSVKRFLVKTNCTSWPDIHEKYYIKALLVNNTSFRINNSTSHGAVHVGHTNHDNYGGKASHFTHSNNISSSSSSITINDVYQP